MAALPTKRDLEDVRQDARDVFGALRTWARERKRLGELAQAAHDVDAEHRQYIFMFLLGLPARKPIFRSQAKELLRAFYDEPAWRSCNLSAAAEVEITMALAPPQAPAVTASATAAVTSDGNRAIDAACGPVSETVLGEGAADAVQADVIAGQYFAFPEHEACTAEQQSASPAEDVGNAELQLAPIASEIGHVGQQKSPPTAEVGSMEEQLGPAPNGVSSAGRQLTPMSGGNAEQQPNLPLAGICNTDHQLDRLAVELDNAEGQLNLFAVEGGIANQLNPSPVEVSSAGWQLSSLVVEIGSAEPELPPPAVGIVNAGHLASQPTAEIENAGRRLSPPAVESREAEHQLDSPAVERGGAERQLNPMSAEFGGVARQLYLPPAEVDSLENQLAPAVDTTASAGKKLVACNPEADKPRTAGMRRCNASTKLLATLAAVVVGFCWALICRRPQRGSSLMVPSPTWRGSPAYPSPGKVCTVVTAAVSVVITSGCRGHRHRRI